MQSGGELDVDKYRLLKTFEASQVSMRLILFHAYFLNTIAKPKGRTVSLVRRVLDACYGRPSPRMKVLLQKRTKELQKVGASPSSTPHCFSHPLHGADI